MAGDAPATTGSPPQTYAEAAAAAAIAAAGNAAAQPEAVATPVLRAPVVGMHTLINIPMPASRSTRFGMPTIYDDMPDAVSEDSDSVNSESESDTEEPELVRMPDRTYDLSDAFVAMPLQPSLAYTSLATTIDSEELTYAIPDDCMAEVDLESLWVNRPSATVTALGGTIRDFDRRGEGVISKTLPTSVTAVGGTIPTDSLNHFLEVEDSLNVCVDTHVSDDTDVLGCVESQHRRIGMYDRAASKERGAASKGHLLGPMAHCDVRYDFD